jgi:ribosomal protein S6
MRLYELTYLIPSNLAEEEIKALQEKIVSRIQEIGGILNEISGTIKKSLAHSIKKNTSVFLATLSFQLPPEKLVFLHKNLKSESNILRYLILTRKLPEKVMAAPVRKPKKIEKPKVELKEIEKKLEEILGET